MGKNLLLELHHALLTLELAFFRTDAPALPGPAQTAQPAISNIVGGLKFW